MSLFQGRPRKKSKNVKNYYFQHDAVLRNWSNIWEVRQFSTHPRYMRVSVSSSYWELSNLSNSGTNIMCSLGHSLCCGVLIHDLLSPCCHLSTFPTHQLEEGKGERNIKHFPPFPSHTSIAASFPTLPASSHILLLPALSLSCLSFDGIRRALPGGDLV